MEEKLYTGKVAIDQFERLIASCHFPEDEHTWVLAERLPDRAVDNTETRQGLLLCTYFKRDILFASYTSGRIFQEDTELRWEKQEGQMHIVYLGSAQFVPALRDYKLRESQALCGLTTQSETRCYYLFGERLQQDDLAKMGGEATVGDFAQVRIPRLLSYPVKQNAKPYARLKVREYLDATTGTVALFRFQSVEAVEATNESI